jgi:hypothetical protein
MDALLETFLDIIDERCPDENLELCIYTPIASFTLKHFPSSQYMPGHLGLSVSTARRLVFEPNERKGFCQTGTSDIVKKQTSYNNDLTNLEYILG